MKLSEEIDKLFLTEAEEEDTLETIKNYLRDTQPYLKDLLKLESDANEYQKVFYYYQLKLSTLSKEIEIIESKNTSIKAQISNKTEVYEKLKEILVSVEIKEDHFVALQVPNFDDLSTIRISLNVLGSFTPEFDIKCLTDKHERIKDTLKGFMKKFISYFQRKISLYESESTGELKIHTRLYEEIKKYDFILDYAKEKDKEHFISATRKYLTFAKDLYEKEFELHLGYVYKALKSYKTKLKEKTEDVINVVFDSFCVIVKCEINFVKNVFHDNQEFIDDYIKNMFIDVVSIILDFLRDSHRMNSLYTINAIYKNKDFKGEFGESRMEIVEYFKKRINSDLEDFKNEYLRLVREKWKGKSLGKRKLLEIIIEDIKNNSYGYMNDEIINDLAERILHMKRHERGKVEFCFYRKKMIYDLKKVVHKKYAKYESLKKTLESEFEKEIIGYVFGGEDSKIGERTENTKNLLHKMSENDNEFFQTELENVKTLLYENITDNLISELEKVFKK